MSIGGRIANSGLSDVLTGPRGPTAVRGEAFMSGAISVRGPTRSKNTQSGGRARVAREERQECVSHCVFQHRAIESTNML
jgi:hypothetical protein